MSSRSYKKFPPGTFIPTPQRLMAIIQLCLTFSLMVWYLTQPFMGEYFALRSRMLLYEYAMGTSDILKARNEENKLIRQAQRFKQLPEAEQQLLIKDYQALQVYAKRSMFKKIEDGIHILMQKVPLFEQAWIFFSILIAILILRKTEGAKRAAWLLPLIVLAYAIDNQLTAPPPFVSPDLKLFPTEEKMIQDYLDEPLALSPIKQKKQLEEGWKYYLIKNWTQNRHESKELQIEDAEFQFNLARLKLLHGQSRLDWLNLFHQKLSVLSLAFFLVWNVLFACMMNRKSLRSCPAT